MFSGSKIPRLGLLCLGLIGCCVSPFAFADAGALERWHDEIGSGYADLSASSASLAQAAHSYCEQDTSTALTRDSLEQAWRDAFLAWQRVRFVEFGPIQQDSLTWQFQFWPDPKNLVGKKARGWLASEREITGESIGSDSVAVKGFPAIEYLLFDEQQQQREDALPTDRACSLLTTVTQRIEANARRLTSDWQQFRPHYVEQPAYADDTVLAAMHALEQMKDRRLGAPIGAGGKGRKNPYLADAWRSGQSLAAVRASLTGLRDLFLPGLALRLQGEERQALYKRFSQQLDGTLERLDRLPPDMRSLLEDDAGYRQLQLLFLDVERLTTQLSTSIAPELGVVKGFNSSDGD
ncbi:hypothetical protein SAMN05216421_1250 [Halopseudomonas xinjiangensis]|uniref:Imelysin-like domain-containing protein n=1 Tax=Halopseudomonas xinjiangensis TaxID=487184 RepID=A0A1H1QZP1_9GAMM|nr:imelysin family protein [Halopseudomonas xinjiangensis]SDS28984.1 hypothetical protein SAMN05216421_1250 [Halopseudomonas xinjiangensis]